MFSLQDLTINTILFPPSFSHITEFFNFESKDCLVY